MVYHMIMVYTVYWLCIYTIYTIYTIYIPYQLPIFAAVTWGIASYALFSHLVSSRSIKITREAHSIYPHT